MTICRKSFQHWVVIGVLMYLPQAYAYLDPVTGSMLIQGLIGAIVGAAVAIKLYWSRLKTWYARITGKPVSGDEVSGDATTAVSTAAEEE